MYVVCAESDCVCLHFNNLMHFLPIVDRGVEAVAVFDRLREVETVDDEVNMATVGGAQHLVGDDDGIQVFVLKNLVERTCEEFIAYKTFACPRP